MGEDISGWNTEETEDSRDERCDSDSYTTKGNKSGHETVDYEDNLDQNKKLSPDGNKKSGSGKNNSIEECSNTAYRAKTDDKASETDADKSESDPPADESDYGLPDPNPDYRQYAIDNRLIADDDSEREEAKRELRRRLLDTGDSETIDQSTAADMAGDLEEIREMVDDVTQYQEANPSPIKGFLGFAEVSSQRELRLPVRVVKTIGESESRPLCGAKTKKVFFEGRDVYFGWFRADSHPTLGSEDPDLLKQDPPVDDQTYLFMTSDKSLLDKIKNHRKKPESGVIEWNQVRSNPIQKDTSRGCYVTLPKKFFANYKGDNPYEKPEPEEVRPPPMPGTDEEELPDASNPPGREIFALIHQEIRGHDVVYLYTWENILRLPPETLVGLFEHGEQFTWFKEGIVDTMEMGRERAAIFEVMYFLMNFEIGERIIKYDL